MKHTPFLIFAIILPIVLLSACTAREPESDAYGTFEADQITISSEASGRLVEFRVREGAHLSAGTVVAVVDTAQLVLQRAALLAQRRAVQSRIRSVLAQVDVLEARRETALRETARFESLVGKDAAPSRQLDEARDQVRLLEREMASVRTQTASLRNEIEAGDAQLAQIADRIRRSTVENPVDGTVLTAFAERHELAAAGRPLYTIANLDTLILKVYVSGAQLPGIRLGGDVEVVVDGETGGLHSLSGTVSRIASEAEFTPRFIQTREERVDLVYAVDVRVPNADGLLKIGMPGEVRFAGGAD